MFNFYNEPYDPSDPANYNEDALQGLSHPLDFKCQCKTCVKFHTITMQDRDWLADMRILWRAEILEAPQFFSSTK